MSLATNVTDLATRIASEVKALRTLINGNAADLSGLSTTAKGNLVAAINEVAGAVGSAGAQINDTTISNLSVWSSSKTDAEIDAAVAALVSAAPGTLDTLNELAAALGDDANFATTINTALGNRVRVDAAQTLTGAQQTQARANIGAGTSNLVIGTAAGTAADAAALTTSLAGKAPTVHGHALTDSNITGVLPVAQVPGTTVGKAVLAATDAAAARTAIGAGTGNSNLAIGTTTGTAADAALTNTALAGKAATSHTHTTAQVTGLDTALAAKADTGHSHANATDAAPGFVMLATSAEAVTGTDTTHAVTPAGLKAVADTKAAATHTHTTAQVTGLDTALAGKAASTHSHTAAQISDASTIGRTVLTAASAAAILTAIGAASTTDVGDTNANFVTTFEAGLV